MQYVLRRTFSISMSMASVGSSSRISHIVRPPRSPRPPAPPESTHLSASPPRLLLRSARSWSREPRWPDTHDDQRPGAQFAVRYARHESLLRASFEFHASSPPRDPRSLIRTVFTIDF